MSQNSFKVDKSLVLKPQATAPSSPEKGQLYVNSSTNLLNYFDGTAWNPLGVTAGIFAPTIATDAATGAAATLTQPATGLVELTSATLTSVTNIPAPTSGSLEFVLINRTGNTITITNNAGGTAANRIISGTSADISLKDRASLMLAYSVNEARWMVVGGTGSASSGSGLGDDLASLNYNISFTEPMSDAPGTTPSSIDITTGKTDSTLYSASNKYFRLNYDASKTVTGSSVNMTMSAAPVFTVKAGDVLTVGQEVRRIATVSSQTVYVLESAFTVTPAPSASVCNVSQCVYSKDLNNFAADGVAPSAVYTDLISSTLVSYNDTATAGVTIPNVTDPALVAFSASSDGTNYSLKAVREANPSITAPITNLPGSGSNLYLRFFSNATSGSGLVNLVGYKAFFHRTTYVEGGGLQAQAYGILNIVGTAQLNSTLSVVGGKTRITFSGFSYAVGANSGQPNGQLTVKINGQELPRYTSASLTPDDYYTESSATSIDLNKDYSTAPVAYNVTIYQSVVDSSTQNTTNISTINATLAKTPTFTKLTTGTALNYTTPAGVAWLHVRMIGGGGGGGGSGTGGTGGFGGNGGASSFGPSTNTGMLTANGGTGAGYSGNVIASGGTATVSAPAIGIGLQGGQGGSGPGNTGTFLTGGQGGNGAFGGGGGSGVQSVTGGQAATNTGGGGAGAGNNSGLENCGGGGGSGGYIDAIVVPTAGQVFTYTVGAAGAFGAPGTSGFNGGTGGSGVILITEHYK